MRVTALILVLLVGAIAFPRDGFAEKVKANQDTKLFARPGERAKVLLKVGEGKAMTVLAKEGRWLKVRVSGRTGYVARSTVDLPDSDEIARNTRRRSFVDGRGTKRGFGGQEGPDDRIGADAIGEGRDDSRGSEDEEEEEEEEEDDPPKKTAKTPPKKAPPKKVPAKVAPKKADEEEEEEEEDEEEEDEDGDARKRLKIARKTKVYNDPDTKSEAIMVATRDTVLFPTGEKSGKFTEVENDEGDLGYVLTADIARIKDEVDDEGPAVGGKRGGSQIDLRVRAGVTLLTQGLRTPNGMPTLPDNYNISTSAATVALGGGYYRPFKKSMIIGGEMTYDYANAFGGIPTPPEMMGGPKTKTVVSVHNLNLRGVIGLDFKKPSGMMVLGRLGFRYHSFQVANATSLQKNTARLPSEIVSSPMIGAALAMPRLTSKIGLRFSLDFMPVNFSYQQTKNLEDGKSPSSKGAIVGAGLTYRWKSSLDIQATYDLTYASATFGDKVDTSMRGHPGGGVKRTDLFHAITVGVVKAF